MEGKALRVLERFAVDMKKMFSRARRSCARVGFSSLPSVTVHATTTEFGRKRNVETTERRNCQYFLVNAGSVVLG